MKQKLFKTRQSTLICIWITVFLGVLLSNTALSQTGRVGKEQMKKLANWVGEWKGEGWQMDQATRQRIEFTVEEKVEFKLNGLALMVEGRGKSADADFLGHHAIGLIYYSLDKQSYEFKSITQDGNTSLSKAFFDEKGNFVWGFEVPAGKVQFTITLTEDTWVEKGAFSMDGNTWYPVMEMRLKKIN